VKIPSRRIGGKETRERFAEKTSFFQGILRIREGSDFDVVTGKKNKVVTWEKGIQRNVT